MTVGIAVERTAEGHVATVDVEVDAQRTRHRVAVRDEDLTRYGVSDVAELVRRAFAFLLAREPNTSILREFRITDIERYFPGSRGEIQGH